MRIFFDEDTGTGVPLALLNVDVREVFFVSHRKGALVRKGTPDEEWILLAARNNWLVFSCNKAMLEAEAQRELLVQAGLGAVFLTSGQETKRELLRLILNQWAWLEKIWAEESRPFAYRISIRGHRTKVDLSSAPRPRQPRRLP